MRVFILEHFFTVVGFLLAFIFVAQILRRRQRPGAALAWMLAIVLIPYVGVPLYFLIGGRKLSRVGRQRGLVGRACLLPEENAAPMRCNAERLLTAAGMPPPRNENIVVLHHSGEDAYTVLMEMLEEAEESIHAMTFILGKDEVGRNIVRLLARKAAEGVEVRLLLDGLGCIRTSGRFVDPIRRAGGHVGTFLPVLPLRRKWSANLRNHRKIVVTDSKSALVGGMNLATSFMGPHPSKQRFLDSAVFLRGPAVADIDDIFLDDWHYATEEMLPRGGLVDYQRRGQGVVQAMASGPNVSEDMLHDAFLTCIMEAQERIWIVTPYFVPDDAILKLLALQARVGRDVRVVVPAKSNHRIADLARGPAVRYLLQAGAKIYAYEKSMVHAKALVFDHTVAITGSPNLDMRSLYLNFEIALFHYSRTEIDQTAMWMEELANDSVPVHNLPGGYVREWVEGVGVLISPLI